MMRRTLVFVDDDISELISMGRLVAALKAGILTVPRQKRFGRS